MNYWQIMNGDAGRDYSQVFFDFGVALAGPGAKGPLNKKSRNANKPTYSEKDLDKIWPLTQMKAGDRVLLKAGQRRLVAVGTVREVDGSVYRHSDCFADVDGWDVQHYVNVEWKRLDHTFERRILTRSTLEGCKQKEVLAFVDDNWDTAEDIGSPFQVASGSKEERLSFDEFEQALVDGGFGIEAAELVAKTTRRVSRLSQWFRESSPSSSEHEIRSFLVIPFLQALGWYPQQIGVEVTATDAKGNYVGKLDIVLYKSSSRLDPVLLIETKKMQEGTFSAHQQVLEYIKRSPAYQSLEFFCTTDGMRYWLYKRTHDQWHASAQMRLDQPGRRNPAYPNCAGTLEFINCMLPSEHDVKFNLVDQP